MTAYGDASLDNACEEMAATTVGRNEALFKHAAAIGKLVGGGEIERGAAERRLFGAAEASGYVAHDGADDAKATIKSGLDRGVLTPKEAPTSNGAGKMSADEWKRTTGIKGYNEAGPWRGTPVEKHLTKRALVVDDLDDVIRFQPKCGWGEGGKTVFVPAMIAPLRSFDTDEIVSIHRTRLNADGKKIGRRLLGSLKGGAAIKLDRTHAGVLVIGEGVETCLAARQLGLGPVWALGGCGSIKTFPVIAEIETLILLQENDKVSPPKVRACAERYFAAGKEVWIVTPTRGAGDLNDALMDPPTDGVYFTKERFAPGNGADHHAVERHDYASIKAAINVAPQETLAAEEGVVIDDFHAYMPMHSYIFAPSREMWPSSSVNARVPPVPLFKGGEPMLNKDGEPLMMSASAWLDRNRSVEQMTWAPGKPTLIKDRLVSDGGWIERKGVACFNLYLPPAIELGDASKADRWIDHIHCVFPDEAQHIIDWLAHRVQHPGDKINHALVLGGEQGIGKDTILEPVKRAIGPWNFAEASPVQMLGRFNGFLKSVILRVGEARDLGDGDRYQFYDHMKAYTAAPPDVLRIDEKNLREHAAFNCCGVIITTNHKTDGIHLPADDRRHFVAWSNLNKEAFAPEYWNGMWTWYERGGAQNVAAYLSALDISNFDPKAPPPKTPAFWEIVDANRAPEDAELADVLDEIGNPDATTLSRVTGAAGGREIGTWLRDRKNRRVIPHRFEKCGYTTVRNDDAEDGLWKIQGARQVVYARKALSISDRIRAARQLTQWEAT